jgi:hypothetical protein
LIDFIVEVYQNIALRLVILVPWLRQWFLCVPSLSSAILRAYIVRALT